MGIFACQKKREAWDTSLGMSGPSFIDEAELGVLQDISSCLKKPLGVSCLQMPPAVSFQAKLLIFHVSSSKGMWSLQN